MSKNNRNVPQKPNSSAVSPETESQRHNGGRDHVNKDELVTMLLQDLLAETITAPKLMAFARGIATVSFSMATQVIKFVQSPQWAVINEVASERTAPGYASHLACYGYNPIMARVSARLIEGYGLKAYQTALAERTQASYLLSVAKAATTLTISRRLKKYLEATKHMGLGALGAEYENAGHGLSDLQALVDAACRRELAACQRVSLLAKSLVFAPAPEEKKARLRSPCGRPPNVYNYIHAIYLSWCHDDGARSGFTYSDIAEDFVDPQTQAARKFSGNNDFNPRAAYEIYKRNVDLIPVSCGSAKGALPGSRRRPRIRSANKKLNLDKREDF